MRGNVELARASDAEALEAIGGDGCEIVSLTGARKDGI
jgi:hypothetical protein